MTDTPLPLAATARIDQQVHAAMARATASLSPASVALAFLDWAAHLTSSPGRQIELGVLAAQQAAAFARYLAAGGDPSARPLEPSPGDRRFADTQWQRWPFGPLHQSFLLGERWWAAATSSLPGLSAHHAAVTGFAARQWLDVFSPGNFPATHPLVLERTWREGGANLVRGACNWLDDVQRLLRGAGPRGSEAFVAGRDVAVTPGKVVMRNRLAELIQYAPATAQARPEPVLIVPAWIMKYYILDLSPHNSLIRHLVSQGHTVFCLSWKNPGEAERDLDMQDYLDLGLMAAIDAVSTIVPEHGIHAAGYCLGGTLLSIGAAAMARDGDARLASLSLLAAQTDFTEPGELALFIDDSQVAYLEAAMAERGYLTAQQMAGAFQMLRSYDLLWSRLVGEYLMGDAAPPSDLMAWNADATRMPARMHSQYLRRLFLDNDLAEGRYPVGGKPVALSDIRLPMFCVGTTTDHVAPWRSVYKLHHETVAEITFVLTSGGHNAGIVSEPGHPHRSYHVLTRAADAPYEAPEEWLAHAQPKDGSWWPEWCAWLDARSGAPTAAPPMGAQRYPAGDDAPGRYVLQK